MLRWTLCAYSDLGENGSVVAVNFASDMEKSFDVGVDWVETSVGTSDGGP